MFYGTQTKLNQLIGSQVYSKAVEHIKQEQRNKGYTDEWAQEQTAKLNKEWLHTLRQAVAENNGIVQQKQGEYDRVKNTCFDHKYTPQDYADLQYLQTLIKARILNECGGQPAMVERVVGEFIYSHKGARAVMFLANDAEIGKLMKPHYATAAENARTAAEKRFDEEKAARLEQMDKAIIPYMQMAVIGDAMLKQAEAFVSADEAARAASVYFGGEEYKQAEKAEIPLGGGGGNYA